MGNKLLRDICELIVDCEHKTAPTQETGYPSIRTPNVGRGRLILEDVNRVSEESYQEWTRRAIPRDGDLILAREAPVGNVAIIPDNLKVCLGQRTVLIRPDTDQVIPSYLVYLLLGDEIQGKFQAYASGATVPHLNLGDIRKLGLPKLPPLPTQRRIAAILSAYDDLIENNTRRIALLEQMAQLLYREWFVHFRFPGHEDVAMVESELGEIPAGWNLVSIGDRFEVELGGTPARKEPEYWQNGDIPWITSGKVNELRILDESEFITLSGLANSSTKIMPVRTTVLAITGATLGQVSLLEIEACANQSVVGVYDQDGLYTEYLYLKFCEIIESVIANASGSAQQHINKGIVSKTEILIPNEQIANDFNKLIRPFFDTIVNLMQKNDVLRRTRDLLLPRLISGEVDVSNLDIT